MSNNRSDRGRGAGAAALIVASFILLAFAGPLLSGERFYFRDLSQNHGPILEGARELVRAGQPLWWNPFAGGGEPLLANPNHLLLVPTGLIALVFAPGSGLTISMIFGALLGAVGLTLLLLDSGRSPLAAAMGGLVYGLSGFAISLGTLPNLMAASSWIPAAILFMGRARTNRTWLPCAVVACAFVLAPCEPASAIVLAAFAFLTIGAADRRRSSAGVVSYDGKRSFADFGTRSDGYPRGGGGGGVVVLCTLLLGLAAAAYQIVPGAMWVAASSRGAGLSAEEIGKWSLSLLRLPELVAPGFLGDPSRLSQWWSAAKFETGWPLILSLHIGAAPLLIGLWAVGGKLRDFGALLRDERPGLAGVIRSERFRALAVPFAGAGFVCLALGLFVPLARWIPGGDLFRYPEKFFLGAMLALAFEVSAGLDALLPAVAGRPAIPLAAPVGLRRLKLAALAMSLGLFIASACARPALIGSLFSIPREAVPLVLAAQSGVALALGIGALEALLLLGALMLPLSLPRWARVAAVPAAVLLSLVCGLIDPSGAFPYLRLRANPSTPAALFKGEPYFAAALDRAHRNGDRVYRYEMPSGFALKNHTGTMADLFAWERRSLARSSATEFGVELAYDRSTDRLDARGNEGALRFLAGRSLNDQIRFWDLASVRLVISYAPLASPNLLLLDKVEGESRTPLLLYENQGVLPRARIVRGAHRVDSDLAAYREIAEGPLEELGELRLVDRSPVRTSHQDTPPRNCPASARGFQPREVRLMRRGTSRLHVDVAPAPAAAGGSMPCEDWLVLAESDVPGWRAAIDGRPVPTERADGIHLAVRIPDGAAHAVDLVYFPPGLMAGIAVTLIALGLSVFLAIRWPAAAAPVAAPHRVPEAAA